MQLSHSSIPRFTGPVTDFAPLRSAPIAAPKPARDPLAAAIAAYKAEQAVEDAENALAFRYREQTIANAFHERFEVTIDKPLFRRRSRWSKGGVWLFTAMGFSWRASDDASGDERYVWFSVFADDGTGWHDASTQAKLGGLLEQGVRLGRLPSGAA